MMMMNGVKCKAYRRGDSHYCDRCAVNWDVNDDNPPTCKPFKKPTRQIEFDKMKEILKCKN